MTTIGSNAAVKDVFQNLAKIVKREKGENVATSPKEYNPQEVKETVQSRYEQWANTIKGNHQPVEISPEVAEYQKALNKEASFNPEQRQSAVDLLTFIPIIANDKNGSLPIEFKTLLSGRIKDLQEVRGISQDTQDILTGLAGNLAKITNQPDTGTNIFAARQAMGTGTQE